VRIGTSGANIVFLPLFLESLGASRFGVLGLVATLQGLILLAGVGVGPSISRFGSVSLARDPSGIELRRLAEKVERVVALSALVVTLGAYLTSPTWAPRLVKGGVFDSDTLVGLQWAVVGLGLLVVCGVYEGLLQAQRQFSWMNVIILVALAARYSAGLVVLRMMGPRLEIFFLSSTLVIAAQTVVFRTAAFAKLGFGAQKSRGHDSDFHALLISSGKLAALSVTATVLIQWPSLALAANFPIELVGAYSLAWTASQAPISVIASPLGQLYLPELSAALHTRSTQEVRRHVMQLSSWLAVLVLPFCIVLSAEASPIMRLWSHGNAIDQASSMLAFLGWAAAFTAMQVPLYMLAIANEDLRTNLLVNVALVAVVPLSTILLGMAGVGPSAALVGWLYIPASFFAVVAPIVFRRALGRGYSMWFFRFVLAPLAMVSVTVYLVSPRLPTANSLVIELGRAAALGVFGAIVAWVSVHAEFVRLAVKKAIRPVSRA
jgi:O-antigen/teichoic acid export membrane protein